ncbi:MAG: GSCFA domain-containing protein, partial [Muribaculaceae bacterium]|nr:GSCFA domain-containing protein [Muribaculaceae bacterium]
MKWHTEITVPPSTARIDHDTSIAMFGSCFTDEIGMRLQRQLFDVAVNPTGTLFNPLSIADAIDDALDGRG